MREEPLTPAQRRVLEKLKGQKADLLDAALLNLTAIAVLVHGS